MGGLTWSTWWKWGQMMTKDSPVVALNDKNISKDKLLGKTFKKYIDWR